VVHRTALCAALVAVAFVLAPIPRSAAGLGFVATVKSTHPIAYYRLTAMSGTSEVGASTYKAVGGVSPVAFSAAALCARSATRTFNARFSTARPGTSTPRRWRNPRRGQHYGVGSSEFPAGVEEALRLRCGISEQANDFDLQFEPDNALRFYTAAGSNVAYTPPLATLEGEWHLVVATFNAGTGERAIYWDGKLGQKDTGGGRIGKTNEFSIGESKVFTGRFFDGDISDVALWNTALGADTVAQIYASRLNAP